MDKMRDNKNNMYKETKKSMMSGTHYFIFDVTNILNKKEFADTGAKVEIVSPSKKIASVNLHLMLNYFGVGVTFYEKGE